MYFFVAALSAICSTIQGAAVLMKSTAPGMFSSIMRLSIQP